MEELTQAIQELNACMVEKIEASRAEVEAIDRNKKARYALQKANERLQTLGRELANR